MDGDSKVYDVEVQCDPSGADVHRARFHSSMIDSKMLREKQKFKELHGSYVIFITKTDVIGGGLPMYHVERVFQETGRAFNDGSHLYLALFMEETDLRISEYLDIQIE